MKRVFSISVVIISLAAVFGCGGGTKNFETLLSADIFMINAPGVGSLKFGTDRTKPPSGISAIPSGVLQ